MPTVESCSCSVNLIGSGAIVRDSEKKAHQVGGQAQRFVLLAWLLSPFRLRLDVARGWIDDTRGSKGAYGSRDGVMWVSS